MERVESWSSSPVMTLSKFFGAVLPLLILGYIFGLLIAAAFHGWQINPFIVLLDGVGLFIALVECGRKL